MVQLMVLSTVAWAGGEKEKKKEKENATVPQRVQWDQQTANPAVASLVIDYVFPGISLYIRPLEEYGGEAGNIITTFVNNNGNVSVCAAGITTTYVYEYTKDLQLIKTMQFTNEYEMDAIYFYNNNEYEIDAMHFYNNCGFTKDNEGNYYFFYGKNQQEDERIENMALVKYNSSGNKLNTFRLKDVPDFGLDGVKRPFTSAACRMEISGNMLCVYFGKIGFKNLSDGHNHQSSFGFVIDKNSFQRVDKGIGNWAAEGLSGEMLMPTASHSWNQFILPIDGGFVLADHCDSHMLMLRGFQFHRFLNGERSIVMRIPFIFKKWEELNYQWTFAHMGGLAKTSDGYIFAGSYEKNEIHSERHNDSRNMFVVTFDNEVNNFRGPIWITDYRDKLTENAVSSKIAALGGDRFLLMWMLQEYTPVGGTPKIEKTYFTIIDKTGSRLTPITELPDVQLSKNDVLRYNRENGNVYWAVNRGYDNKSKTDTIDIYSFNPDIPLYKPPRPDDYGLLLADFTPERTSVARGEDFKIRTRLKNNTAEPVLRGYVGAVLTDNRDNIVAVLGTSAFADIRPFSYFGFGNSDFFNMNYSSVEPTVQPGQYQLRIAVNEFAADRKDFSQWKIITQSVDNAPISIDFTVR